MKEIIYILSIILLC